MPTILVSNIVNDLYKYFILKFLGIMPVISIELYKEF